MNPLVIDGLGSEEELHAGARSRAYAVLCEMLKFPDREQIAAIREGALAGALRASFEAVDPSVAADADWDALGDAGAADDAIAVEYTQLFEVGTSGPPCALYGGLYGGARMKTMEEAVRFYNHFGLTLSEDPRELPDHLTTELEFLHFLAFREAEALRAGIDPGPYRRAQRDFVARHPVRWVPQLVKRLARAQAGRFYAALFDVIARWLAREERTLVALVGPAPLDQAVRSQGRALPDPDGSDHRSLPVPPLQDGVPDVDEEQPHYQRRRDLGLPDHRGLRRL